MGQLNDLCGGYQFDVEDFRSLAPEDLVGEVIQMTRKRFVAARALAQEDDWNLLWMVEMGLDRLHHALWDAVDPAHPRHRPGSPLAQALCDYYILLDEEIGRLWELCDDGLTALLVVSDHGARSMMGGVCVNRWLTQRGLLVLKEGQEETAGRFDAARVDWSRTRAWSMGGYCARVFLHLEGRDPGGTVAPSQAPALLQEIAAGLEALPGPEGQALDTRALETSALFGRRRGAAPDLMVYFGDLGWRAIDTIGGSGLYTRSNDTGPDAANHDWDGVLVMSGAGVQARGAQIEGASLLHIAPLLRHLLGARGEEA
jgi:predicted AlkP superfamily phosphohydrolase/phosphomutase